MLFFQNSWDFLANDSQKCLLKKSNRQQWQTFVRTQEKKQKRRPMTVKEGDDCYKKICFFFSLFFVILFLFLFCCSIAHLKNAFLVNDGPVVRTILGDDISLSAFISVKLNFLHANRIMWFYNWYFSATNIFQWKVIDKCFTFYRSKECVGIIYPKRKNIRQQYTNTFNQSATKTNWQSFVATPFNKRE